MGSSYSFDGSIQIAPPLNYAEIKTAEQAALGLLRSGWDCNRAKAETVFEGYMPLKLSTASFTEETDRGPLEVTEAVALVPSHETDGSLSYAMEALVTALVTALPGHGWNGRVIAVDEDHNTATRVTVGIRAGEKPTPHIQVSSGSTYIKWDDGSSETKLSDVV